MCPIASGILLWIRSSSLAHAWTQETKPPIRSLPATTGKAANARQEDPGADNQAVAEAKGNVPGAALRQIQSRDQRCKPEIDETTGLVASPCDL